MKRAYTGEPIVAAQAATNADTRYNADSNFDDDYDDDAPRLRRRERPAIPMAPPPASAALTSGAVAHLLSALSASMLPQPLAAHARVPEPSFSNLSDESTCRRVVQQLYAPLESGERRCHLCAERFVNINLYRAHIDAHFGAHNRAPHSRRWFLTRSRWHDPEAARAYAQDPYANIDFGACTLALVGVGAASASEQGVAKRAPNVEVSRECVVSGESIRCAVCYEPLVMAWCHETQAWVWEESDLRKGTGIDGVVHRICNENTND